MDYFLDKLIEKIGSKPPPQRIRVIAEQYAEPDDCFNNVLRKIEIDNGSIIYGWKIFRSQILIEAEKHAIWKSDNGELIDITPDNFFPNEIFFIEDDTDWKYEGNYEVNIIINTTNNPLVDDFILLSKTIMKLKQTGERNSKKELIMLKPIADVINFLSLDKYEREKFIYSNKSIDSLCYCNSGNKYKDCHGLYLKESFKELIDKAYLMKKNHSHYH